MTAVKTQLVASSVSPAATGGAIRFPGLNTLRLYAALAVILEHVSIQFPLPHTFFKVVALFFLNSQHAVNLFFVLSGFLITYLFMQERAETGTLYIRGFYLRRALRILPLYYWIILLGLVIFPLSFGPSYPLAHLPVYRVVLAFLLLPNFASLTAPLIHLWSIGVEEQFYVFWPWANRSDASMLKVCLGILFIKVLLTPIILSFHDRETTILFFSMRFECMAIGALGAYVYTRKHLLLSWIYRPWIQAAAIAAVIFLLVWDIPINTYNTIWSSLLYIVLILNIATNPQSILKLNHPRTERFGEISYGLYMYHFPVLYVIYYAAYHTGWERLWTSPFLLLLATLAGTWAAAFVSYRWLETPFLNRKKSLPSAYSSSRVAKTGF